MRVYFTKSFFLAIVLFLIAGNVYAIEICRSPEDAAKQALALKGYEICKAEVVEWRQYSEDKETQLANVQKLSDAYKEQVSRDDKTINELRTLALMPEPKFKIVLAPYLYAEGRFMGTSDIARAGIGLDILRWKGFFVYAKVEGSIKEVSTKQQGDVGIYGGARWYPFR